MCPPDFRGPATIATLRDFPRQPTNRCLPPVPSHCCPQPITSERGPPAPLLYLGPHNQTPRVPAARVITCLLEEQPSDLSRPNLPRSATLPDPTLGWLQVFAGLGNLVVTTLALMLAFYLGVIR